MTLRLTFGIDPGLSGAIAVLTDGKLADVFDMPTVGRGKAGRQTVNAPALAARLREHLASHPGADVQAVVEDVAARPGQGVTSMFRFGHSCGAVDGVLGALRIPMTKAAAQRWKRHHALLGSEKDASRGKAIDLYPEAPLSRKRDHGRADAILLARWHHDTTT
ncbi:hypothetical protein MASR1M8_16020 [Thermomonas brevis]